MEKLLNYLKYLGLFIVFIIVISLITSLISLTGINSILINKLGIILTALSFFIVASIASSETKEKGYILGLKLGLLFIIILLFTNLIIFKSSFSIDRLLYYIILISSGILGGSFGKNFKINLFARKK
ncbi:MAG: TIGR04086 family membrane protein [Ruminococcus sp.]|nr:TIGR04086 family membrane protein [Ruminococcus sp.]